MQSACVMPQPGGRLAVADVTAARNCTAFRAVQLKPHPFSSIVRARIDATLRLAHQLLPHQAWRIQRHVCAKPHRVAGQMLRLAREHACVVGQHALHI